MTTIKKPLLKRPLFLIPMIILGVLLLLFIIIILIPIEEETESVGFSLVPVSALSGDNGSYTYDDGQMELAISPATSDEAAAARDTAESVLSGESNGNSWTISTDDSNKSTAYINAGASTVKAEINKLPVPYGKENAAAVVSTLIRQDGYTKGKKDYSTAYSTYYIEAADCILYYPSQLSVLSVNEDNSLVIKDTRSNAVLNVRLTENNYSSMDELEGFISASENNLILAYGPAWYSAEQKKNGKTTFSYDGLGQNYIVEAQLTYADQDAWVFDELRMQIKCKFIDDGVWVSKAKADGYSNDTSAVYGSNFSRQLAAYYDAVHGTILLYPELFSQKQESYGIVEFTDPLTGAKISYYEDTMGYAMKDFASGYGYDDSYIDGERRVKMSDLSGGRYAVASYTENATVVAELYYPAEYEWVYEQFYGDFTIVTTADEIHNTEMQTVKIPEYGAIITLPLQFTEQSFYGGTIIFADSWNGLELSVTFSELSTPEEKTNLFACFDCIADDDDIMMGDSWLRWESNAGFFYGARGADMKALMKMEVPNAAKAYSSMLNMFQVEFVTEESRDVTIADEVDLEAQVIEEQAAVELEKQQTEPDSVPDHSDPVTSAKVPNTKLIYNYDYEYAYVAKDAQSWFEFDESDKTGQTNFGSYMILMSKLNAVKDIISVLSYNNYTIDDQSAGYLMDVARKMDQILKAQYYNGEPVTSDLGEGVASVFETMCSVMSIPKPEYVDHHYDYVLPDRTEEPPAEEEFENGIGLNDEPAPVEGGGSSSTVPEQDDPELPEYPEGAETLTSLLNNPKNVWAELKAFDSFFEGSNGSYHLFAGNHDLQRHPRAQSGCESGYFLLVCTRSRRQRQSVTDMVLPCGGRLACGVDCHAYLSTDKLPASVR
ncbi:MAG: hypothetical protein PHY23_01705 [Oscillospiraceae bacterium]|nr:hypothetical protein [Oscillospiraceae bacterium]